MKTIFIASLLIVLAATCDAQTKGEPPPPPPVNVKDYFRLLPAEYITHTGDYGQPLRVIEDVSNGYYALNEVTPMQDSPGAPTSRPVFEFALYRKADGGAVFVAANTLYDHACFSYETYFLKHDGARWSSVAAEVAPRLGPELFFRDPEAVAALKRSKTWHTYLRYRLARRGTTIQVTPQLCDTAIEYDDTLSERARAKLRALLQTKPKTVTLNWDRARGRFFVAR